MAQVQSERRSAKNAIKDMPFLDTVQYGNNTRLLKRIPDNSIDLVVTSPPYFNQRIGERGARGDVIGDGSEYHVDEYVDAVMDVFNECVRVIRPSGSIVFNVGDKYSEEGLLLAPYRFAIRAIDTKSAYLVNAITWFKSNPTPRQYKRRLVSSTEPFFHFVKDPNYYYDPDSFMAMHEPQKTRTNTATPSLGGRYRRLIQGSKLTKREKTDALTELDAAIDDVRRGRITSFRMKIRGIHSLPFGGNAGGRLSQIRKRGFTIIRMSGASLKKDAITCPVESLKWNCHPAVYPVRLIKELVALLTPPGAIVLDPYMGSGSTGVAAKTMGRHYIGMEINPKYCAVARERIDSEVKA